MSSPTPPLPRDFPDRAIRDSLLRPENLRALVRRAAPELADRLDYNRMEIVPHLYLLDDWRKRDLDVLVRLPLLGVEGQQVLICLLIEHQSSPDPVMPLRLMLYAVLFWEDQWRAWEQRHDRGVALRLTPIIPVVFHTGPTAWNTNRDLAELWAGPEELRVFAPIWRARLSELVEQPAAALLQEAEPFWQALAVVRAERQDAEEFRQVFTEVLQRLEPLAGRDPVTWQHLMRLALYWALFRRPRREHTTLIEAARHSHQAALFQQEVQTMTEQLEQTWERELEARFHAAGRAEGELLAFRRILLKMLRKRFGEVPDEVVQRINTAEEPALQAALDRVDSLQSLADLGL